MSRELYLHEAVELIGEGAVPYMQRSAVGFESGAAVADARIPAWRARARGFGLRWREERLVPCPGTPMGPAEWAL